MIIREATSPVEKNTRSRLFKIFLSLFMLLMLATELLIVTNTKGTTIVNMAFINKSPRGFNIEALSLSTLPRMLPKIIDPRSIIEKR